MYGKENAVGILSTLGATVSDSRWRRLRRPYLREMKLDEKELLEEFLEVYAQHAPLPAWIKSKYLGKEKG